MCAPQEMRNRGPIAYGCRDVRVHIISDVAQSPKGGIFWVCDRTFASNRREKLPLSQQVFEALWINGGTNLGRSNKQQ